MDGEILADIYLSSFTPLYCLNFQEAIITGMD